MLVKFGRIVKGWWLLFFGKRTEAADKRLLVCMTCPFRKGYFCGECWCELHAKSMIEEEECPKGFWK